MEEFVKQSLLYDFYGELLTEHQRSIYEAVVFDDLSLSEAAADFQITRQGVHDLIRRVNGLLTGYEEKLHLVQRFLDGREKAAEIHRLGTRFFDTGDASCIREILRLSEELSQEL